MSIEKWNNKLSCRMMYLIKYREEINWPKAKTWDITATINVQSIHTLSFLAFNTVASQRHKAHITVSGKLKTECYRKLWANLCLRGGIQLSNDPFFQVKTCAERCFLLLRSIKLPAIKAVVGRGSSSGDVKKFGWTRHEKGWILFYW